MLPRAESSQEYAKGQFNHSISGAGYENAELGLSRFGNSVRNAELPSMTSGWSFGLGPRFAGGVSDLWLAPPHPENVLFPSGRPMRVASRTRRCNALSVHPSSNIRFQFSPIWSSRNATSTQKFVRICSVDSCGRTGPHPFTRISHHTGSDGIQFDITQRLS